jgi:hypothetical protein
MLLLNRTFCNVVAYVEENPDGLEENVTEVLFEFPTAVFLRTNTSVPIALGVYVLPAASDMPITARFKPSNVVPPTVVAPMLVVVVVMFVMAVCAVARVAININAKINFFILYKYESIMSIIFIIMALQVCNYLF